MLLVGHGTARRQEASATLARHAEAVARTGRFARVRHAALSGGPDPADALREFDDLEKVLVLPMFMCSGILVERLLPQRLGPRSSDARIRICPPLGAAPELALLAGEAAAAARREAGWPDRDSILLLAAHGSPGNPASRRAAEDLARRLARDDTWRAVQVAYLEEAPFLADTITSLRHPAVVLGLFAADGGHAVLDVSEALTRATRPVRYTGALGADAGIPDVVLGILARELRADAAAA